MAVAERLKNKTGWEIPRCNKVCLTRGKHTRLWYAHPLGDTLTTEALAKPRNIVRQFKTSYRNTLGNNPQNFMPHALRCMSESSPKTIESEHECVIVNSGKLLMAPAATYTNPHNDWEWNLGLGDVLFWQDHGGGTNEFLLVGWALERPGKKHTWGMAGGTPCQISAIVLRNCQLPRTEAQKAQRLPTVYEHMNFDRTFLSKVCWADQWASCHTHTRLVDRARAIYEALVSVPAQTLRLFDVLNGTCAQSWVQAHHT